MTSVKFSIVTPTFNQAVYIERTLQSVLGQLVDREVEYLLIDGGSTDGTLDILEKYAGRIRMVSEPDRGMADALNKGFALCTGNVIGWLNSDDLYLPGTLQKVAAWFENNPGSGWVYGNCRMIDAQDRATRKWITAYKNHLSGKFSYERLLVENFISQPAVFMRREALQAAGPVDLDLPAAMDYDLWIRLAKLGKPGYIHDDLACFRVHDESISSLGYKAQFKEQYMIHKRYDQNRWRLMKHRVTIMGIVFVYSVLKRAKSLFKVLS